MKIVNIHTNISVLQLYNLLQQQFNTLFQQQKQSDLQFRIEQQNNAVEISLPEVYEGFLFRIEPEADKLNITRSEHYVDDVNSLTAESVLNSIFEQLAGDKGISLTQEG